MEKKIINSKQEPKTDTSKNNKIKKLLASGLSKKETKEKEVKKMKAPFKILLCITFESLGSNVLEIFKTKNIKMSMVVKGYGTAQNNMLAVLGVKESERDIVIGVIKSENCENIISEMLQEFEKYNMKNTFCCLISPSSANVEMLSLIKTLGGKN